MLDKSRASLFRISGVSAVGLGQRLSPVLFTTSCIECQYTSADFADFLASPSPLHKCLKEVLDAPRRRHRIVPDLASEGAFPARHRRGSQ